jgi:hypothetical protein
LALLAENSAGSRSVGMAPVVDLQGAGEDLEDEAKEWQQEELEEQMADSGQNSPRQQQNWCAARSQAQGGGLGKPVGRKNIQWLHLHNFGGTFMCQEAARQGEATTPFNCNWEDCSQQTGLFSCQVKAKSEKYTFSMMERNLQTSDLCTEALFGTMLRDPVAGMQSTLVANKYDKAAIMKIMETSQNMTAEHSACLPSWDTYQHFDNFATRSISGAYMLPPGGVTQEHLDMAKQRLRDMDVVLVLEELKQHAPQLSDKFGWDLSHLQTEKRANVWSRGTKKSQKLLPLEADFLRGANAIDYELYAFGKQLAAEKTAAASKSSASDSDDQASQI